MSKSVKKPWPLWGRVLVLLLIIFLVAINGLILIFLGPRPIAFVQLGIAAWLIHVYVQNRPKPKRGESDFDKDYGF